MATVSQQQPQQTITPIGATTGAAPTMMTSMAPMTMTSSSFLTPLISTLVTTLVTGSVPVSGQQQQTTFQPPQQGGQQSQQPYTYTTASLGVGLPVSTTTMGPASLSTIGGGFTGTTAMTPQQIVGGTTAAPQPSYAQPLVITHVKAILMLSAWLIFAPVAIVSARLLKPEKAEWLGTRAWFWLHRTCNSLCVFCVVAGLVCIFVAMGGQWLATVEVGQQWGIWLALHPLFGILASALAIAQPIIALFRCDPQSAYRPIFNFVHRLVGYLAWACAGTAIMIATTTFSQHFSNVIVSMSLTIAALGLFLVVVLFSVCFNWWSADRLEGQAPVQAGVGGGGGGSSAVGPQNGRLGWSMPAVGTIANPQNGTAMNGGGSYGGAAMYKNVAEPTLPKWERLFRVVLLVCFACATLGLALAIILMVHPG